MAATGVYQVAILGPGAAGERGKLQKAIQHTVKVLGLPPGKVLRFLAERNFRHRSPKHPLAAVYFGGPKARSVDEKMAQALIADDAAILPVVPRIQDFKSFVPECLHPINGMGLDADDPELVRVSQWVTAALGLVRHRRFSFISYYRQEATRLALQLHQEMDARGWTSFLDTHSLAAGVDFQAELWDRMNDADLLVLLDSPKALSREYVRQEIERADQLGMGVLQVVWPGHKPDRATDLALKFVLEPEDFRPGSLERRGGQLLRKQALGRLLAEAERLRARSLAARRDRLVRTFMARARDAGLTVARSEPDRVDVAGRNGTYAVVPVVGHVDSTMAFRAERRLASEQPAPEDSLPPRPVLLYDNIGLLQERIDHILWLDEHLPVKSVASQGAASWAEKA